MDFIKKNLSAVIVAVCGLVAIILSLFLAGVIYNPEAELVSTVSLIGMIFGSGTMVMTGKNPFTGEITKENVQLTGGGSTFALISFVVLVIALLIAVLAMFKDNKFSAIAGLLLIVSGVLMFLLLSAGSSITVSESLGLSQEFTKFFEGYRLGIGAIIYAILSILGGALGILTSSQAKQVKSKRKKK